MVGICRYWDVPKKVSKSPSKKQRGEKRIHDQCTYSGEPNSLNVELEKALRLSDFIEIGRLMALDALNRNESCGGHFREEFQTPDGEALRQDDKYMYVSCWEYQGEDKDPVMYKEELKYEAIKVQQRNYKQ